MSNDSAVSQLRIKIEAFCTFSVFDHTRFSFVRELRVLLAVQTRGTCRHASNLMHSEPVGFFRS